MPLILLGFLMVSLPLIGAIVTAIAQVNAFSENSQDTLVSVKNNTYNSTLLMERITLMERSARQYQALLDTTYKELYAEHRLEVLTLFSQLNNREATGDTHRQLAAALTAEETAYRFVMAIANPAIASTNEDQPNIDSLEAAFATLREKVLIIVSHHNARAQELSNAMPEEAARLQKVLVSQAIWVIPFSVALALIFALFIARPLRQINQGIRSLGHGSLAHPIRVSGSRELEELGRQLNFLRFRLIKLEAQKVQFLRNVSHELKTPLTNVRQASELLFNASDDEFESDGRIIVPILLDNSIRLQKMIEELLVFGADNDLTDKSVQEHVRLDKLVQDAIAKQSMAAKTHAIRFHIKLCKIALLADAKRLGIMIDNLLANAIKYTDREGDIYINLSKHKGQAIFDIKDSGAGVSEQDKPYIFDWFYTGAKPPSAVMPGTGMGLAISQEYAIQQGGKIVLIDDTEAVNESAANFTRTHSGGHFRLILPLTSPLTNPDTDNSE